jgi:hypothetical protein
MLIYTRSNLSFHFFEVLLNFLLHIAELPATLDEFQFAYGHNSPLR